MARLQCERISIKKSRTFERFFRNLNIHEKLVYKILSEDHYYSGCPGLSGVTKSELGIATGYTEGNYNGYEEQEGRSIFNESFESLIEKKLIHYNDGMLYIPMVAIDGVTNKKNVILKRLSALRDLESNDLKLRWLEDTTRETKRFGNKNINDASRILDSALRSARKSQSNCPSETFYSDVHAAEVKAEEKKEKTSPVGGVTKEARNLELNENKPCFQSEVLNPMEEDSKRGFESENTQTSAIGQEETLLNNGKKALSSMQMDLYNKGETNKTTNIEPPDDFTDRQRSALRGLAIEKFKVLRGGGVVYISALEAVKDPIKLARELGSEKYNMFSIRKIGDMAKWTEKNGCKDVARLLKNAFERERESRLEGKRIQLERQEREQIKEPDVPRYPHYPDKIIGHCENPATKEQIEEAKKKLRPELRRMLEEMDL